MTDANLLKTPLYHLHLDLGARMVPFAGYEMPVQYPSGLMTEHHWCRNHAGLFDVSHMGQLRLVGEDAKNALESLMPVDVLDLPIGKQRYGLLTNETGGILDDLMFVNRGEDIFMVVNGACKKEDIEHIVHHIGKRCKVIPMPEMALLALQGPSAAGVLSNLIPQVDALTFMQGASCCWQGVDLFITRSGYTGEDGFEISIHQNNAMAFAKVLLENEEVKPVGLGARNSLRLEAGLCLYGNDIDVNTTPAEAALAWAVQKVRRNGGARAGGFIGADTILPQLQDVRGLIAQTPQKQRVGLKALERVPVREHTLLCNEEDKKIGEITSGLLSPTLNEPIAMAYVDKQYAKEGTVLRAMVRDRIVPMKVVTMPFVAQRYKR